MIQSRFWSTSSNFSDEDLKEACERIKRDEEDRIDDILKIVFCSLQHANDFYTSIQLRFNVVIPLQES